MAKTPISDQTLIELKSILLIDYGIEIDDEIALKRIRRLLLKLYGKSHIK